MPSRPHRLKLSSEDAFYILFRAREFDDVLGPDTWAPADEDTLDLGGEADETDAWASPELAVAIGRLTDEARRDLVALIWIGRGDFAENEWTVARKAAGAISADETAAYVADMPLVSDYLEDGLAAFGHTLARYVETH